MLFAFPNPVSQKMDSNQPEKDFEVAIVGGGICGLALACALAHKVKMVVFETAVNLVFPILANLPEPTIFSPRSGKSVQALV